MSGSGTPTDEREALARDLNKARISDLPGTAQSAHDPFAAGFGGAGSTRAKGKSGLFLPLCDALIL